MQITYVLELLKPTKRKESIIQQNINEVSKNRACIASKLKDGKTKLSTANLDAKLPSAVSNQDIREVKALYKRFKKSGSKKDNLEFKPNQPICYNNQNYKIKGHFISVPLYVNKSSRCWFPVVQNKTLDKLSNAIKDGAKLGRASLFYKNKKYYFAVTLSINVKESNGKNIMGIDIGLNQLAVASVVNSKGRELNRAFYSGKKAGYIRRRYKSFRKQLGKAKKPSKIRAIGNKESRYIKDLNHKISRELINLAVQEEVSTVVMENLKNIRKTAKSSKRADKNLNSWAFYELQQFIEYKAKLAGIKVIYVNPQYTSQKCSKCGTVEKSNRQRNLYSCNCGNNIHADLNASRNISRLVLGSA
jgi:putative transposase